MRHGALANAACGTDQRRTRRLQFPHAKLVNAPRGIWAQSTQYLTESRAASVLSLLSS